MNPNYEKLGNAVRYFYDLQKLRIQSGNRNSDQAAPAVLDDYDKAFLGRQSEGLNALEKDALKEVSRLLKGVPIWEKHFKDKSLCKGVGPTMAGVMIAEIDITRCDTVSALWAYCGLAVDNKTGSAVKRSKGQKANWNPFLKTKVEHVLGGCLLKANNLVYRKLYDDYKHRKQNQLVAVCMLCAGSGVYEKKVCYNCEGKKHNVPWGRSDAHRNQAAIRYMVKMFLKDLWVRWRELEGLPVTEDYASAALGRQHGDHGGMTVKTNPRTGEPYNPRQSNQVSP